MTFDWKTFESIDTHESLSDSHEQENKLPMKRVSETVVTILNYKDSKISYIRVDGNILIYRICDDGVVVLWKLDASLPISKNNLSLRLLSPDFVENMRDTFADTICQECNWDKQKLDIHFNIQPKDSTEILPAELAFW